MRKGVNRAFDQVLLGRGERHVFLERNGAVDIQNCIDAAEEALPDERAGLKGMLS
jgi:hypothetical protein